MDGFLPVSVLICIFFFFQAEDGIRDYKVTGVQTCALPICFPEEWRKRHGARLVERLERFPSGIFQPLVGNESCVFLEGCEVLFQFGPKDRSEERRVGKECRSRWSPYH